MQALGRNKRFLVVESACLADRIVTEIDFPDIVIYADPEFLLPFGIPLPSEDDCAAVADADRTQVARRDVRPDLPDPLLSEMEQIAQIGVETISENLDQVPVYRVQEGVVVAEAGVP